jgi:hypothetical protein
VGPLACPFVAFEHDQARRAIEPDRRHRCYAEPAPAPRTISIRRPTACRRASGLSDVPCLGPAHGGKAVGRSRNDVPTRPRGAGRADAADARPGFCGPGQPTTADLPWAPLELDERRTTSCERRQRHPNSAAPPMRTASMVTGADDELAPRPTSSGRAGGRP